MRETAPPMKNEVHDFRTRLMLEDIESRLPNEEMGVLSESGRINEAGREIANKVYEHFKERTKGNFKKMLDMCRESEEFLEEEDLDSRDKERKRIVQSIRGKIVYNAHRTWVEKKMFSEDQLGDTSASNVMHYAKSLKAEKNIDIYEEAENIYKEKLEIDAKLEEERKRVDEENDKIVADDISKIVQENDIPEKEKKQMVSVLTNKLSNFIGKSIQPKTRRKILAGAMATIAAGGLIWGYLSNLKKTPSEAIPDIQDQIELSQEYLESEEEVPSIDSYIETKIPEQKEEKVPSTELQLEEEDIPEEITTLEEEEQVPDIEDFLNDEIKEILSLTSNLEFDQHGNLFFENGDGEMTPVLTFETERHLSYPYEPLNDVKFFVIHYDAGPLTLSSGSYRTVFNTLNGLNRAEKPSVQFCIDSYPITSELNENDGLGVILSQRPNTIPYKGRHVQIGINLETGEEDKNRILTANMFEDLGVGSNFANFVNSGNKDFDSYSLGVEQTGTRFTTNFPENFPPNQQIANMVSLTKAVAVRYDLNIWDIIGHNEIQQKSDPGDEYMLILRTLLGIEYLRDKEQFPENFLGVENEQDYFEKLREYGISKMGEQRYNRWREVYEMDSILEVFEDSDSKIESDQDIEELDNILLEAENIQLFAERIEQNETLKDIVNFGEAINSYSEGSSSTLTDYLKTTEWYREYRSNENRDEGSLDYAMRILSQQVKIEGQPLQCVSYTIALAILYPELQMQQIGGSGASSANELIQQDNLNTGRAVNTGFGGLLIGAHDLNVDLFKPGDHFVQKDNTFGHVGSVIDVFEDENGTKFLLITESNKHRDGRVTFSVVSSPPGPYIIRSAANYTEAVAQK